LSTHFLKAHSFQMLLLCSNKNLTFVSPFKNHKSSDATNLNRTLLVVSKGNPLLRSKRIWLPNLEYVPVFVLSLFIFPSFNTNLHKSRYCFSLVIIFSPRIICLGINICLLIIINFLNNALNVTPLPFTTGGRFPRAWLEPPRKKFTSCGVSRLMLFPQESPPSVPGNSS